MSVAGGNEIASGKLNHPESSAALAVNAFGWFIERPALLPALPQIEGAGLPTMVDVEFCARFPWPGGRHPWLDAVIETSTHLIGVESKRFEPFRDAKQVALAAAYDRPVWGNRMTRFEAMRDNLRSGVWRCKHLDAAQLVKHAFGLVTEARRRRRKPVLFYIFAEPATRGGRLIADADRARHREEIARFGEAVAGDEVRFVSCSYAEWLDRWTCEGVAAHAAALRARFAI